MGQSVSLAIYMLLSRYGEGWFARKLKTDTPRLPGIPSAKREGGSLIWINAVSINGAEAVLAITQRLLRENPNLTCLITVPTETIADAIRNQISTRVTLQYTPLDTARSVNAFLDHWRPDISVWTEHTFKPTLVVHTKRRKIPAIYIDANLSAEAPRRGVFFKGMTASLLRRFDHILARDTASAKYIQKLGVTPEKVEVAGRMNGTATPLDSDETQRKALARAIGGRAVWLAAMTHNGEESVVAAAHREVLRSYPELLLIIAPYDATKRNGIAKQLCDQGFSVAQRSLNEQIDRQTDIYLADTCREMGLWYRLAPVSFLGGSLVGKGGHNPLSAATLGSAIIHGPEVSNYADTYKTLANADACIPIVDGPDLARKLEAALAPERAAQLATAAWGACGEYDAASDRAFDLMQSYLGSEAT